MTNNTATHTTCSHCGDECGKDALHVGASTFCCNGCKMVFQLLSDSGLQDYYRYEQNPGISPKDSENSSFDYLEDERIVKKLLDFDEGDTAKITLHLPQIHCSSCLYLLENIRKLNCGIVSSRVNFSTKKASITYHKGETSLREIISLLTKIGYEPAINLESIDGEKRKSKYDKVLLYKLGLAGFAFGNIMLLSFPEYLGFDKASYLFHIGYINIILATPVLLYSGIDYLKSAFKGIRYGNLNIDLPIALGMVTLYGRSVFEILSHSGEGFLDSFTGFVFFLLIGRWFQSFTYEALDFERNYKSYFPIAATVKKAANWITKPLTNLEIGDIVRIRNQELIPADSVLLKGKARIDYSFVTGESELIPKNLGDLLYAGGKHKGEAIEIQVAQKVDQSYLTQLWNEDTFKEKKESSASRLIGTISKYFTLTVLILATATMAAWYYIDSAKVFETFTAVLIVACPCALALAIPFTYGNIVRLLSQNGLYLKNVSTIEDIQDIDHIIFDKTGTITDSNQIEIFYDGKELTEAQETFLKSACSHSSHPLSKAIVNHFGDTTLIDIDEYTDFIGEGFVARLNGHQLKVGSSAFIFGVESQRKEQGVFIEFDGRYVGFFKFEHQLRKNIPQILSGLGSIFKLSVLSGDTAKNQEKVQALFTSGSTLHFEQKPKDKLEKIKQWQAAGEKVMMIGDGLNDAGALKQSDVGVVISDKANNFSPACDGVLKAENFETLYTQIVFLKKARYIIYGAFVLAFLYNFIGLYFAVTGQLSPVIAAILMPVSSITVILYGVGSSILLYKHYFKK